MPARHVTIDNYDRQISRRIAEAKNELLLNNIKFIKYSISFVKFLKIIQKKHD